MENKGNKKINKYKEFVCSECSDKHSCCDLSNDLIDEQVKSCMDKCPDIVEELK